MASCFAVPLSFTRPCPPAGKDGGAESRGLATSHSWTISSSTSSSLAYAGRTQVFAEFDLLPCSFSSVFLPVCEHSAHQHLVDRGVTFGNRYPRKVRALRALRAHRGTLQKLSKCLHKSACQSAPLNKSLMFQCLRPWVSEFWKKFNIDLASSEGLGLSTRSLTPRFSQVVKELERSSLVSPRTEFNSSQQVSSTSVTSNSAEICTPMSCFQAARPFSKGLVSTEILRASRRKHHHCCRQTLPLRFLPAAEKAKSIADMVLQAPRGKHPHCWRQTLPLRGCIVLSRRREGYCS